MAASATATAATFVSYVALVGVVAELGQRLGRPELLRAGPVPLGLVALGLGLLQVGLGALHAGLRRGDLRRGDVDVGLVDRVVDLREQRAGLHARAVVDRLSVGVGPERRDLPGDLAPTSTTSSGSTVPVAPIVCSTSPRVTFPVR